MHRSGTSLLAGLLESAGLFMGPRLMDANPGNPWGYFEDLDFVVLHMDALTAQDLNEMGWTEAPGVAMPSSLDDRIGAIVAERRGRGAAWGWKDPRTALFLEHWRDALPEAVFAFVYRAPWEVADSLLRRSNEGDDFFKSDPAAAVRLWLAYNRRLLRFVEAHGDRCVLMHSGAVKERAGEAVDLIANRFGLALTRPDPARIVESGAGLRMLPYRAALVRAHCPEAAAVYDALHRVAVLPPSESPQAGMRGSRRPGRLAKKVALPARAAALFCRGVCCGCMMGTRLLREALLIHDSGLLDEAYYRRENPDVAKAGIPPLVHFVTRGAREGRPPHPLFDMGHYVKTYDDADPAQVNPLVHFLRQPLWEGRRPNSGFDPFRYLDEHPDAVVEGVNPLVHYVAQTAQGKGGEERSEASA